MKKKVVCIKDLYKSTYEDFSFTKGKEYSIIDVEHNFIWIMDNQQQESSFLKIKGRDVITSKNTIPANHFHSFEDFF